MGGGRQEEGKHADTADLDRDSGEHLYTVADGTPGSDGEDDARDPVPGKE